MVTIHVVFVIIFLFGSSFAQSDTADSSNSLQAEATVEIQYDGELGSGIILMTSYPASYTTCVTSNSSPNISCSSSATSSVSTTTSSASTALTTLSLSTPAIRTSSASSTYFNIPLLFGSSRTQIINASSTSQYLSPTAASSSQNMTSATDTQSLSGSSIPTPQASLVAGLGIQHDVTWSHVFFWAAVTEILLGFL